MSKADDLRALREAKYARGAAYGLQHPKKQPAASAAAPTTPVPTTAAKTRKKAEPVAAAAPAEPGAAVATGECGHRNMMGRACTREAGHAAKSHRYS